VGEKRYQARAKAGAEQAAVKVQEEQTILGMQKQIEELKRKSEQGSQQLQGEVQELQLEALLRGSFPHDTVTPVAKGEFGGDTVQHVSTPYGQQCGKILWESKRTRNWSDGWLQKLRDDQRTAKADAAILVSQALPNIDIFGHIDGVWITAQCRRAVCRSGTRSSGGGAHKSGETSRPRWRHIPLSHGAALQASRQAMAENSGMQADLDRERKAMQKSWAKREQQILGIASATSGMWGDMQGIAGRSLPEIEGLDFDGAEAIEGASAKLRLIEADS
jgi:hypothetical protein